MSKDIELFRHGGARFLRFPKLWQAGLWHAFSTRDQNLLLKNQADKPELKAEFTLAQAALPATAHSLYYMVQRHSAKVALITGAEEGELTNFGRRLDEVDGLLTAVPSVCLASAFADCVPILLYDPVHRVQANVHSGWKGTLQAIASVAVRELERNFSTRPQDLLVALGPHIGPLDFEVEQDVESLFRAAYPTLPELIERKNERKYLIKLEHCIRSQLTAAGVRAENVLSSGLSTVAEPELLHSYRRDKDKFGLMFVFSKLAQ